MSDAVPNQHRYETFNDRFFNREDSTSHTSNNTFHPFSRLPPELRLKIWTSSLRKHRLLPVVIQSNDLPSVLNSSIHVSQYRVFFPIQQKPCVLSRVCVEAARVSRNFYRVPLPYCLDNAHLAAPTEGAILGGRARRRPPSTGAYEPSLPEAATTSIAYLNPEWDILEIHMDSYHHIDQHNFVDFISSLKANDPRGIGVVNLSLSHSQIKALSHLSIADLSPAILTSYKQIIAGLRRLFWRVLPANNAHGMAGPLVHTSTYPWYNTSMPLMAHCSAVEFLGPDPRLQMLRDLRQVWVGRNPRNLHAHWGRLESALGVRAGEEEKSFKCRVLLAVRPWDYPLYPGVDRTVRSYFDSLIADRDSVDRYIHHASTAWVKIMAADSVLAPINDLLWQRMSSTDVPPLSPAEFVATHLSRTAVGFWLIDPVQLASPDVLVGMSNGVSYPGKTVLNLTKANPDLCLFDLSA